jgi:hypothetical protein
MQRKLEDKKPKNAFKELSIDITVMRDSSHRSIDINVGNKTLYPSITMED